VVITGASRDPVYASGFFTLVFGTVPVYADRAWVWRVLRGPWSVPASGVSLAQCRAVAAAPGNRTDPLAMSKCVLSAAGGA
jgi:hypothetical protein